MAFDVSELAATRVALDDFCSRHSQPAGQVRFGYEIDCHSVVLSEMRPDSRDLATWDCEPFAKFRFYRSRGEWLLYWVRSDGKWHRYEPAAPARRLSTLVGHVDRDTYGCFLG